MTNVNMDMGNMSEGEAVAFLRELFVTLTRRHGPARAGEVVRIAVGQTADELARIPIDMRDMWTAAGRAFLAATRGMVYEGERVVVKRKAAGRAATDKEWRR